MVGSFNHGIAPGQDNSPLVATVGQPIVRVEPLQRSRDSVPLSLEIDPRHRSRLRVLLCRCLASMVLEVVESMASLKRKQSLGPGLDGRLSGDLDAATPLPRMYLL